MFSKLIIQDLLFFCQIDNIYMYVYTPDKENSRNNLNIQIFKLQFSDIAYSSRLWSSSTSP